MADCKSAVILRGELEIPANKKMSAGICNPCGMLVRVSNPQIYYTGLANPREHNLNVFVFVIVLYCIMQLVTVRAPTIVVMRVQMALMITRQFSLCSVIIVMV